MDHDPKDLLPSGDRVPHDYDSAMALAMLWATGKHSWWNDYARLGNPNDGTGATAAAACAQADTAEVERWCAVARAFAAGALLELAMNPQVMVADSITTDMSWTRGKTQIMIDFVRSLDDGQLGVLASLVDQVKRS